MCCNNIPAPNELLRFSRVAEGGANSAPVEAMCEVGDSGAGCDGERMSRGSKNSAPDAFATKKKQRIIISEKYIGKQIA